ncbi:MAG: serine/threonine-protein phosphatase [Sedimentisphaerales bacterium]|nr:serine/threonine-protein phosphatase [Sedimentisphaerales bacterium]
MRQREHVLVLSPNGQMPDSLGQILKQLDLDSRLFDPLDVSQIEADADPLAAVLALEAWEGLDSAWVRKVTSELTELEVNTLLLRKECGGDVDSELTAEQMCGGVQGESVEMLKGRLMTLKEMRPAFKQMQSELEMLRQMQKPLNQHFTDVSEEMHLASRLQQDFLPRRIPEVPGLRFATVYRPASWVSGDIYDIIRLDEKHVGFYVADAVGHGMPAALLTMFIKTAMITKKIKGKSYTIVEPGDAIAQLNNEMVEQNLSNNQFVTCCYGIINTETWELRMASAGHPFPMHIDKHSQARELDVSGKLLGVFSDLEYETFRYQLAPGDKLLTYSDGVEMAFENAGPDQELRFRAEFGNLADCSAEAMCQKLVEIIDREEGSLHPRDDVTIVAMEISERQ